MKKLIAFNEILRRKTVILLIGASLLSSPLAGYSQNDPDLDLPCNGVDPYAECPIDAWTCVLAIAGISFGIYSIYRSNKLNEHKRSC